MKLMNQSIIRRDKNQLLILYKIWAMLERKILNLHQEININIDQITRKTKLDKGIEDIINK